MAYESITVERKGKHGGIVWLEFNRPEKLNALTFPLLAEMYDVSDPAAHGPHGPRAGDHG